MSEWLLATEEGTTGRERFGSQQTMGCQEKGDEAALAKVEVSAELLQETRSSPLIEPLDVEATWRGRRV